MKRLFPVALLVLVIFTSGCTSNPLDWLFPGPVTQANDVVVIKGIQVTPSNQIESGQAVKIYADIENIEEAGYDPAEDVKIVIYDYCENLFEKPIITCPSTTDGTVADTEGVGCKFKKLKPKEIRTLVWTLKSKSVKVTEACDIKMKVEYKFTTRGSTRIVFINTDELTARIRRGESWKVSPSEHIDYGPVKPYVSVVDQQPVPFGDSNKHGATIKVQIKNVGNGFVSEIKLANNNHGGADGQIIKAPKDLTIKLADEESKSKTCPFTSSDGKGNIDLIQKESSPLFCTVTPDKVESEKTFHITSELTYRYEFRKTVKVSVKPIKTGG